MFGGSESVSETTSGLVFPILKISPDHHKKTSKRCRILRIVSFSKCEDIMTSWTNLELKFLRNELSAWRMGACHICFSMKFWSAPKPRMTMHAAWPWCVSCYMFARSTKICSISIVFKTEISRPRFTWADLVSISKSVNLDNQILQHFREAMSEKAMQFSQYRGIQCAGRTKEILRWETELKESRLDQYHALCWASERKLFYLRRMNENCV